MLIQNQIDIRIEELAPRILKTIDTVSNGNNLDFANLAKDVFSNLFEIAKQDPSFINQKDWYIIAQVKSMCIHRKVLDKVAVYLDEYRIDKLKYILNPS